MRFRRSGLFLAMVIAGCITPYAELPLCTGDSRGEAPTTSCRLSPAVEDYQAVLATEVLRRSQWQYPPGLPLQVRLNDARRVTDVCVGSQDSKPGWNTRDRVASSLRSLRGVQPGPECLANTTIDLSSALLDLSIPEWAARLPPGMASCDRHRDDTCLNSLAAVCGVFKDGRRRTYGNSCDACEDDAVVGFFDFECE